MGKQASDGNHNYLLMPVSAQAQTKRNRSEQPLRSRTQPRITCDLKFHQVCLSLTDVKMHVFKCSIVKVACMYIFKAKPFNFLVNGLKLVNLTTMSTDSP